MKPCTVEGCDRPYYAKGFCNMHYRRNRAHGDPLAVSTNRFPSPICSVPGCEREHASRGLCAAHRNRLQRGDLRADLPIAASTAERFWAKVDKSGPCWEWRGTRTTHGHGQFGSHKRIIYAHRFAYEQLIGAIPVDCVLHHRCENPACVNPHHLEVMTQSDHAALHQRIRFPPAQADRAA